MNDTLIFLGLLLLALVTLIVYDDLHVYLDATGVEHEQKVLAPALEIGNDSIRQGVIISIPLVSS